MSASRLREEFSTFTVHDRLVLGWLLSAGQALSMGELVRRLRTVEPTMAPHEARAVMQGLKRLHVLRGESEWEIEPKVLEVVQLALELSEQREREALTDGR